MIAFIEKLNSEVLRSIERIESRDTDVLKKSLEASRVLGEAFDRLKQYIIGYRFQNDDEEIKFFKEIKPRLFCRLIYYRKLYNIEMNRPVGSIEAQREYLDAHVRAINAYTQKRLDFIRYFRSGATHLDSLYFLRGQTDTEQYLETFYYELDPQFSTNADFKVAKILANDMLSVYLMGELESLESTNLRNMVLPLPDVRPTWQDSKTDLTELIYLLDSKGCFGNVPLTQLASYISNAFNVHLDMNLSRTFCDMKIRNNPTPWLDKAKEALLKRMQTWKRNKKNSNSE